MFNIDNDDEDITYHGEVLNQWKLKKKHTLNIIYVSASRKGNIFIRELLLLRFVDTVSTNFRFFVQPRTKYNQTI